MISTMIFLEALGASNFAYLVAAQLGLKTSFSSVSSQTTSEQVEEVVYSIGSQWGMFSICDIVINHTANETPWLTRLFCLQ